jgi:hypothetical protein
VTWQPPSPEDRRTRALALRADAIQAQLAIVATYRTVGAVCGVLGLLVAVLLPLIIVMTTPGHLSAAIVIPPLAGLGCMGYGVYAWIIFKPLPKKLLATGVATPAVVLSSGMVGPELQARRGQVQLRRHRYRVEVRPEGALPYEIEIRTFDGPMLLALNAPPLTVYVDPRDPKHVCPDWSTLPAGA